MNQKLLRYNNSQKFLVFDLETEGLNLLDSRPWQCSWMIARGDKILRSHDRFIWWPDLRISDRAAFITKFDKKFYSNATNEYLVNGQVVQAETVESVFSDFRADLYNPAHKILGQNILNFDVYLIAMLQRILGEAIDYSFMSRVFDTRALAIAIAQEQTSNIDHKNLLGWQYRMISSQWRRKTKVSAEALLKQYGIEYDPKKLHDGLYDINRCYDVFRKQLFDLEI